METVSTESLNAPSTGGGIENLTTRLGTAPDDADRTQVAAAEAIATAIAAPATAHGSHGTE
jgi:hypothetical protein